jgi:hypothetical protein
MRIFCWLAVLFLRHVATPTANYLMRPVRRWNVRLERTIDRQREDAHRQFDRECWF